MAAAPGDTAARSPRVELVLTANYDAGAGRSGLPAQVGHDAPHPSHALASPRVGSAGSAWPSSGCSRWRSSAMPAIPHRRSARSSCRPRSVCSSASRSCSSSPPPTGRRLAVTTPPAWRPCCNWRTPCPRHLRSISTVKLVLAGAGDAEQIGLRRHLSMRRRSHATSGPDRRRAAEMIVLAVAASDGGTPRWWHSDGAFLPLRYSADAAADGQPRSRRTSRTCTLSPTAAGEAPGLCPPAPPGCPRSRSAAAHLLARIGRLTCPKRSIPSRSTGPSSSRCS